jgi:HEPN domain-containing protein
VQRTDDWLNQARAGLRAAWDLHKGGHWSWCCFTCQQVAESALKAACDHFRTPQFGHNLNLLLKAVEAHAAVTESVRFAGGRLNRFYIPTRYPDAFPQGAPVDQFFEPDAHQALMDAREVLAFVEGIIEAP